MIIKTSAGKCRIVPVHDRIMPFVKSLVDEGNKSKDVGNRVYNHKTIEQLLETVALLK